jgi:protein involved in polysaccharide export with SLBB domain
MPAMFNKSKKILEHKVELSGLAFMVLCLFCVGCSEKVLDPSQIGRFRPVPVVNVILDSLGVEDEPEPIYAGAEDPRPEDIIVYEQDYVFGIGDAIRISIFELLQQGRNYVNDFVVTESGRISIPDVGQIRAAGLTEIKLEEEIKDILSPNILIDPIVTITMMSSQSRIVSVSGGGVGRSTRTQIPRTNFRLLDLVAASGGVNEFNVSNIYVIREVSGDTTASPSESIETYEAEKQTELSSEVKGVEHLPLRPSAKEQDDSIETPRDEIFEVIAPYEAGIAQNDEVIMSSSEMITQKELEALATPTDLGNEKFPGLAIFSEQSSDSRRIEWVFEDGKWIPLRVGPQEVKSEEKIHRKEDQFVGEKIAPEEETEPGYGWEQVGTGGKQTRVIKIPVDKLFGGDPRYNIVIRGGDSVSIPVDIIGEFYVTGNLARSGPINLTGRPMTLKMAISAAGGLTQLAWPKKVEVIRRIGRNKEEIVMVDLDKIAQGLQPDFFIKPDDLINVGTHPTSIFRAVLRNAFRASYGFGFIYDRNFRNPDTGFVNDLGDAFDDFRAIF